MKRREYTPEQLAFMTGITKSEDPELNEARDTYKKLCKEYEAERKPEQEKVKNWADYASSVRNVTNPVVSITSCEAVRDVRETRVNPSSSFPWKTI